jgi:hypothetical protein
LEYNPKIYIIFWNTIHKIHAFCDYVYQNQTELYKLENIDVHIYTRSFLSFSIFFRSIAMPLPVLFSHSIISPLARSALTISPFAPLYMSGQGMDLIFYLSGMM